MNLIDMVGLLGLGVGVGALIGCVGIGGVLLVPSMAYLFGVPIHVAIAVAMFSYIFSGAVGVTIYTRHGSIVWRDARWIVGGAAPAAFAGAFAVSVTPGVWLEVLIAALIVFAGIHAMRRDKAGAESLAPALAPPYLFVIGAVTGIGSAMTGTGGPLILVPIAVWLGYPALAAVGLSQAVQVPIAASATVGNVAYGVIDWGATAILSVALIGGTAIGARAAHAVPTATLRRILSWVLVLVGLFIVVRLGYDHMSGP
jgi:uncharacterized membrane protein YfcA